jgi:hypothetical protein
MTNQVGPATGGSVAGPGSGAGGVSVGASPIGPASAGTAGQDVAFVSQVSGTPVSFPTFHGRAISWVAVSVIMAAFLVGGVALVVGPIWWLFWVSVGVAALGVLVALGIGIFDDWY